MVWIASGDFNEVVKCKIVNIEIDLFLSPKLSERNFGAFIFVLLSDKAMSESAKEEKLGGPVAFWGKNFYLVSALHYKLYWKLIFRR
jgi:hypothetical protein